MMQVIFSKIQLETSPFLTVIQFYSNIDEKRVGKSPQEISTWPTFRNILTNLKLKKQDKTKMELPLDMVSKHAFWYFYLQDYKCFFKFLLNSFISFIVDLQRF